MKFDRKLIEHLVDYSILIDVEESDVEKQRLQLEMVLGNEKKKNDSGLDYQQKILLIVVERSNHQFRE